MLNFLLLDCRSAHWGRYSQVLSGCGWRKSQGCYCFVWWAAPLWLYRRLCLALAPSLSQPGWHSQRQSQRCRHADRSVFLMQSKIWLGNRRTSTGFDNDVYQLYISHRQAWLKYLLHVFCLDGLCKNAMYFNAMFCLDLRFTFPRMHWCAEPGKCLDHRGIMV